ncbi:hypothetical protein [Rhodopirellula halodulae]|uniref:hypothetical protein n=1 Tax=Rhodopirellula halodulae TaxID=2894198 RepID=UPI001E41F8B9|nr:hypothetical protein [Rhodopirellula sp. JC737]MCC9654762.1 hypothetical protein [Rhodopirellula sp. JC737]
MNPISRWLQSLPIRCDVASIVAIFVFRKVMARKHLGQTDSPGKPMESGDQERR